LSVFSTALIVSPAGNSAPAAYSVAAGSASSFCLKLSSDQHLAMIWFIFLPCSSLLMVIPFGCCSGSSLQYCRSSPEPRRGEKRFLFMSNNCRKLVPKIHFNEKYTYHPSAALSCGSGFSRELEVIAAEAAPT
jgi:hypothetical protein